jgi:hypothetical protein
MMRFGMTFWSHVPQRNMLVPCYFHVQARYKHLGILSSFHLMHAPTHIDGLFLYHHITLLDTGKFERSYAFVDTYSKLGRYDLENCYLFIGASSVDIPRNRPLPRL